jgi:hypothetical protein
MEYKGGILAGKNGKQLIGYFKSRQDDLLLATPFLPEGTSTSERVYCLMHNLDLAPLCECGATRPFHKLNLGYFKTCGSPGCVKKQRSKNIGTTMIERYGEHTSKLTETKKKIKDTLLSRHGDENYVNVGKRTDTMFARYNVSHALQLGENVLKKKHTQSLKYGDENYNNRAQIELTNADRYGGNPMFDESVRAKAQDSFKQSFLSRVNADERVRALGLHVVDSVSGKLRTTCVKCQSSFVIGNGSFNRSLRLAEDPCMVCNPRIKQWSSRMERDLAEAITAMGVDVICRHRVKNREIDIYIPSHRIGIEFNGLYWHSEIYRDKDYHRAKKDLFAEVGIEIIHIYEDEWIKRRDIVLSVIANKIGLSERVHARKCTLVNLSAADAARFMEDNHMQGKVGASHRLGLMLGGVLVGCMLFGKTRAATGRTAADGEYEMLRFCTKRGLRVTGGASRLFAEFRRQASPSRVISYASYDRSNGGMYLKLGFTLVRRTPPNYWYVIGQDRLHRYGFRKDRLVAAGEPVELSEREIMLNKKIPRLFDSGSLLYEVRYV